MDFYFMPLCGLLLTSSREATLSDRFSLRRRTPRSRASSEATDPVAQPFDRATAESTATLKQADELSGSSARTQWSMSYKLGGAPAHRRSFAAQRPPRGRGSPITVRHPISRRSEPSAALDSPADIPVARRAARLQQVSVARTRRPRLRARRAPLPRHTTPVPSRGTIAPEPVRQEGRSGA
jgi:hypothetical protein